MLSAAASPFGGIAPEGAFCKPEEDPFLLLESSLKAIERILQGLKRVAELAHHCLLFTAQRRTPASAPRKLATGRA
jgi:hypothetical protein